MPRRTLFTDRRVQHLAGTAALLALVALLLLPAVHSSLRFDDTGLLEVADARELRGEPRVIGFWRTIEIGVEQGRFQPLAGVVAIAIDATAPSRVAYKLTLIALTVLSVWLASLLARRLGLPTAGAALCGALGVAAIQFRLYHDPVLGYFGVTQVVLVLTLLSLLAFHRALTGGSRRAWAASIALFICALAVYEAAIPLAAAFPAIALAARPPRRALAAAAPFLASALAFAIANWLLRKTQSGVNPGYDPGLDPGPIVETLALQWFAAIPGSYTLLDPAEIMVSPTRAELLAAGWRAAIVTAIVGWVLLRAGAGRLTPVPAWRGVALTGVSLALAAPVLVAFAPKYQDELELGMAYLPGLVQALGFGLAAGAALVAGLSWLHGRRPRLATPAALIATALVAAAAFATFYGNHRVVAIDDQTAAVRGLMSTSLERGLADALPEDTTLLFHKRDMDWPRGKFDADNLSLDAILYRDAGRRVDARFPTGAELTCPRARDLFQADCGQPGPSVAWMHLRPGRDGEMAILAGLGPDGGERPYAAPASWIRVYVSGNAKPAEVAGIRGGGSPWTGREVIWREVDSGGDWSIHEATPATNSPVAFTLDWPPSPVDFRELHSAGDLVRQLGTKRLLP